MQRNTGYNQTDVLQKFFVPISKNTDLKINLQYSTSSDVPRFDRLAELKNGAVKFAEWNYGPQKRLLISSQLLINPNKNWLENGVITVAYQNINGKNYEDGTSIKVNNDLPSGTYFLKGSDLNQQVFFTKQIILK